MRDIIDIIKKIFKAITSPFHKMGPRVMMVNGNGVGTDAFLDSDVLNEQAKVTRQEMEYYKKDNVDGNILTLYNTGKVSFRNLGGSSLSSNFLRFTEIYSHSVTDLRQ